MDLNEIHGKLLNLGRVLDCVLPIVCYDVSFEMRHWR